MRFRRIAGYCVELDGLSFPPAEIRPFSRLQYASISPAEGGAP